MITLRPDQVAAVDAILAVRRGIVKAPAGSGKTFIAAAAIRALYNQGFRLKIAWYAHTMEQCEQARAACEQFDLVSDGLNPAIVSGFFCYQSGHSAAQYDLVILDECHHIAAEEFRKILDGQVGGRWGFSATPKREDDLADDVFTLIGPIVHTVERAGLVETGKLLGAKVYFHAPNEKDEMKDFVEAEAEKGFAKMKFSLNHVAAQIADQPIESVARRLGLWKEISVAAAKDGIDTDDPFKSLSSTHKYGWLKAAAEIELRSRARWHACQTNGIFENSERNVEIARRANEYVGLSVGSGGVRASKDSVLILVGSIEHGRALADSIPGSIVVYSKMGVKKRRAAIQGFRDGSIKCVIATSLADEGLDVPRANVLILAAAGRSEGKVEQRTGRVLREFAEQTHGIIHDFWDHQHPLLLNQSRVRARVYAGLNYEFAGGDAVQVALRAIGIKIHPLLENRGVCLASTGGALARSNAEGSSPSAPQFDPRTRVEPKAGTRNNGMVFRDGAWHNEIKKETSCGLHQPKLDSATSHSPLSTKTRKRKRKAALPKERKHARLSPSILKAKAICPGFINDPHSDKTAANRGTLGHKAVEKEDPNLCGQDTQLWNAVKKCIDYKHKIIDPLHPEERMVFQEIKFEYFEQWGFCDVIVINSEGSADLLDWKFAYNFYEADAPQFWAYCLGAWNRWPQLETIRVHVAHPFLDEIDIETFTRTQHYSKFQINVKGVIAQSNLNRPEDYRVTAQCAYCGFAGQCAKLAQVGVEIGKRYATDLVVPADTDFHGSKVTDPATMVFLYRLAVVVEKAAGGWKRSALEMYDNGVEMPGVKKVTRVGKRTIDSARAAFDVIEKHFVKGLKAEDFLKHCAVSATDMDAIVKDATPKGKKEAAVRELAARLEDADAVSHGGGSSFLVAVKEEAVAE